MIRAHHARDAVAVRDADAGKPERSSAADEFLRMRRAAQEGEMGCDGKLRIGRSRAVVLGFRRFLVLSAKLDDVAHANTPCMNQRVGSVGSARPFAIKPHAHAFAALDAEIVAHQRVAGRVAPPLHGDAFRAFDAHHDVAHAPPGELRRRSVRHFGDRLDRLRPREQADRAGGGGCVVIRSAVRPLVPAKAGTQLLALDSRLRGNERNASHRAPPPPSRRIPEYACPAARAA